jgi:hypothetical protein
MTDCLNNHWYVLNQGVAVTAQRKRIRPRSLQQTTHLAGDLPLYLECTCVIVFSSPIGALLMTHLWCLAVSVGRFLCGLCFINRVACVSSIDTALQVNLR